MWVGVALAALAILGAAGLGLYRYGKHSWRFRIDSSDQIEVAGAEHVAHAQIMEVMGGDIGRNIFFVPLAQRQAATGTDSVGGIGERDALCAESPAHRDS